MRKKPSSVFRFLGLTGLTLVLIFGQGCASKVAPRGPGGDTVSPVTPPAGAPAENTPPAAAGQAKSAPAAVAPAEAGGVAQGTRQVGARISTYYLSSNDEIRVSVFGYPELTRNVRIPPDGHAFFPVAGDLAVDGMSIPELRRTLEEKLRTADEQRIGTGDQIMIRVYRNEDLGGAMTVASSGRVQLPLAGEVQIAGLTVEAANNTIAEKLTRYVLTPTVSTTIIKSASGLPGRISDPHVSVEVMAFGGHKVLVLGEVQRPGVYVSEGGSRLLEMMARAGGPTEAAKLKNVALVRPATETSAARTALVNLELALKSGDANQNPTVQRGDIIYVPRTTVANLARFFRYIYEILRPFVTVETGIWLGQNIEQGPADRTAGAIVFQ